MSPTIVAPRRVPAARPRPSRRGSETSRPPRRVSGPVGGRLNPTPTGRPRSRQAPRESIALGGRAFALVRGLPDHSLIDRLVRGRAWIPVLGVLLTGIVAMQVEILKLGTSMGRAMERSATLQTQNGSLLANVASLADDQRIERLAAGMGMVMPTPNSMVFLHAQPSGNIARAIGNIQAPDPTGFASQLAAQAAAAAALMPAAPPAVPATSAGTGVTSAGTGATSAGTGATSAGTGATSAGTGMTSGAANGASAGGTSGQAAASGSPATGSATTSGQTPSSAATTAPTSASAGPSSTTGGTSGGANGAASVAPASTPQSTGAGGG
jgi:hypothetical protein